MQLLEAVINWNQILTHIPILDVNGCLGSRFTGLCASLCVVKHKGNLYIIDLALRTLQVLHSTVFR